MDLYPKNPTIIKKLLAKRQNPATQTSNPQTSNPTTRPNLLQNPLFKASPPIMTTINAPSCTNYSGQPQVHYNSNTIIVITVKDNNCGCGSASEQSGCGDTETAASEDGGSGGRGDGAPIKKMKLSPESKHKRSNCYEDEAEFSTTCESYSDGNSNEFSDYYSPTISYTANKDARFEEFRLDDEDCGSCNQSFHFETMSNASEEESIYLKEANERASRFEGRCMSSRCPNDKVLLKFQCKYKHTWEMSLDELRDKWCAKCEHALKSVEEFARSNGGRLINKTYSELMFFECARKHNWTSYHKNAKRKWCSQCMKDEKEGMKKRCEQERAQKQMEDEELQKRLFEEARRKAMQDINSTSYKQQVYQMNSTAAVSLIEYYKKMDYETETLAKKNTSEFMSSKEFCGQCDYQQILQVYKILIMPEEILKNYMLNLTHDALKGEFRRLAKLIHPDKNKHPKAGAAFQKIHRIYEAATGRLDSCSANI